MEGLVDMERSLLFRANAEGDVTKRGSQPDTFYLKDNSDS